MEICKIIKGSRNDDLRGTVFYNNDFDTTQIKRIYLIENTNTDLVRGWQGHKIEQRWFSVVNGSFKISVIPITSFETNSPNLELVFFELFSNQLNVLHIPGGYVQFAFV